jgi:hypothetical protein
MLSQNIFSLISIDEFEATPRYIQLTNSVLKAIEQGLIPKGYWLPSINELSYEMGVSRETAEKVYKRLRKMGIISSFPGKGSFISSVFIVPPVKIFLLFNKISSHKKIIYDSFVSCMGKNVIIDFFVYNNDIALFKKILRKRRKQYSNYVIIPPVSHEDKDVAGLLSDIPREKLLLLNSLLPNMPDCAAVYENFERDIFQALKQALHRLANYHSLKIVFPDNCFFPDSILKGFISFCSNYAFEYEVITDIKAACFAKGEVYICLVEEDLVFLVQQLIESGLKIGYDVGVISYNETPLKKFILDGITTISADFSHMGETASKFVLANIQMQVAVPFYLTLRKSL